MNKKDIFSQDSESSITDKSIKSFIPKWAVVLTVCVLLASMLVGGIFIGLNINGVDFSVKDMSKKMPYLDDIYDLIDKHYLEEIDWDSVQDMSIAGMLALDQFSGVSIMEPGLPTPKMGITTQFSIYNEMYISVVNKNTPAASARGANVKVSLDYPNKTVQVQPIVGAESNVKIERGDKLVALKPTGTHDDDYMFLYGLNSSQINQLLGAYPSLDMVYEKPNGSYYAITVGRAFDINSDVVSYSNLADITQNPAHKSIGYLKLDSYDGQRIEEIFAAIHAFIDDPNAQKLIFDLRNNGGGDLRVVQYLMPYLMQNGDSEIIAKLEDKYGAIDAIKGLSSTHNGRKSQYLGSYAGKENYELAVLVNSGTASASEVTLGALRYYEQDKVFTVGSPTYGKGVAQSVMSNVCGRYEVAIVSARIYLPVRGDGETWQKYHGVPMVPDHDFFNEDNYDPLYGRMYADLSQEIDVKTAIDHLLR